MNNYHKGKLAELLAAVYMFCHGYRIIGRNFITGRGTKAGEVDLICLKNRTVIFVEIKQRSSLDNAAYAISKEQRIRIIKGAQNFLKSYAKYHGYDIRFDALLISFPFKICHIKNAWQDA